MTAAGTAMMSGVPDRHAAPHAPPVDVRVLTAVFAGGVVGTLARAGIAEAWAVRPGHWPWATFAVNLAGTFLLGLVVGRARWRALRPLLGTGLCGALTTFSTFQVELLDLADADRWGLATGYAAASVAAGLAAVALGLHVGRR